MTKSTKEAIVATFIDMTALLLSLVGSGIYFFRQETQWMRDLAAIVFLLSCICLIVVASIGWFCVEKRIRE